MKPNTRYVERLSGNLIFFVCLYLACVLMACSVEESKNPLTPGTWRAVFEIGSEGAPVLFTVSDSFIFITNGEEKIKVDEFYFEKDSVVMKMPVFDTEIRAKVNGECIIGIWYNHARSTQNEIPFSACFGQNERFVAAKTPATDFSGNWEIEFSFEDKEGKLKSRKAQGVFNQANGKITGSILTPTGDYRFLEGVADGDEIRLSSFNGASVYLFSAKAIGDTMEGTYFSGIHHWERWKAFKNDDFRLPDPDTLTKIMEGVPVAFSFPDLSGKIVTYPSQEFAGKVVVLQLMGSWCPNCLDETILLSEWYKQYKSEGFEVVSLAFENTDDFDKAKKNVERIKARTRAEYTFLIAGKSDKKLASEALPFLNQVMAFPTTVFIDRNGVVRKIHTGFSGPATGEAYKSYVAENIRFLSDLLAD